MVQSRRSIGWRVRWAGLVAAAAVAGCGDTPAKPPREHPIEVLPLRSFTKVWSAPVPAADDPIASIDVRPDTVYVYTRSKHVYAFERRKGSSRFSLHVDAPGDVKPLVELRDKVVFPTDTGLEVYDLEGAHLRSVPLAKALSGEASGSGELIFFGADGPRGGLIEAYDMSDDPATVAAPFRWERLPHLGGEIQAAPVVYESVVFFGSTHGEMDAVNPSATLLWPTDQGMFLASNPVGQQQIELASNGFVAALRADESGLYAACKNGQLFCLNRPNGKLQWEYFSGQPLTRPPVLASDTVYQQVPGLGVVALAKDPAATGKNPKLGFNRVPKWEAFNATQFLAQDDRYAYLAQGSDRSDDGTQLYRVIAVDKQTGAFAFKSDREDFVALGSNGNDDLIYGAFADGTVMAVRPVLKPGQIGELVMAGH